MLWHADIKLNKDHRMLLPHRITAAVGGAGESFTNVRITKGVQKHNHKGHKGFSLRAQRKLFLGLKISFICIQLKANYYLCISCRSNLIRK
jgi:hypothetical protein